MFPSRSQGSRERTEGRQRGGWRSQVMGMERGTCPDENWVAHGSVEWLLCIYVHLKLRSHGRLTTWNEKQKLKKKKEEKGKKKIKGVCVTPSTISRHVFIKWALFWMQFLAGRAWHRGFRVWMFRLGCQRPIPGRKTVPVSCCGRCLSSVPAITGSWGNTREEGTPQHGRQAV